MFKSVLTQGAHRLFGFLTGSVLAGSGLYYYVIDEYKVSNELLMEDIYVRYTLVNITSSACDIEAKELPTQTLQAAVSRIEQYVRSLEEKIEQKK